MQQSYLNMSINSAIEINQTQSYVTQFITLMNQNQSCDIPMLATIINQILLITGCEIVTGNRLAKLMECMTVVQKLSNFPVTVWQSDGKAQTPASSSLGSLLNKTLADNYHSVRAACRGFNKTTGKCKYGNQFIPGSCDHMYHHVHVYHIFDSVSIHLVLTCIINALC